MAVWLVAEAMYDLVVLRDPCHDFHGPDPVPLQGHDIASYDQLSHDPPVESLFDLYDLNVAAIAISNEVRVMVVQDVCGTIAPNTHSVDAALP